MKFKKLAGAAIAALVGLGMLGTAAPATAGSSDEATITITGPAAQGRTFAAYRIATYANPVFEGSGGATALKGFDLETVDNDSLKGLLGDYLDERATSPEYDGIIDPMQWIALNWTRDTKANWDGALSTGQTVRDLANYLSREIGTLGLVNDAEGQAGSILRVPEGLYLVVDETDGLAGVSTYSLPIIVGTPFMNDTDSPEEWDGNPEGTINVKGDLVEIDKDIVDAGEDLGLAFECLRGADNDNPCGDAASGNEEEDWVTARTGDTVTFRIRTSVPVYPESITNPTFTISDEWSTGLEPLVEGQDFALKSLNVGYETGSGAATTAVLDYRLEKDGDRGFKLVIPYSQDLAGKVLVITYDAVVKAGGTQTTRDWNTAQVEFTRWKVGTDGTPTAEGSLGETQKDGVDVYTYPLQVNKSNLNEKSAQLQATFQVFLTDSPGAQAIGQIITSSSGSGLVTTMPAGGTDTTTPLGLKGDSWYFVKETKQPAEYTPANLNVAQFWVYIASNASEGGVESGSTDPMYYFSSTAIPDFVPEEDSDSLESTVYFDAAFDFATAGYLNDSIVTVYNVRSASDMPSTGGQILLWVGIAGALGLGAVTFAAVGARKARKSAA